MSLWSECRTTTSSQDSSTTTNVPGSNCLICSVTDPDVFRSISFRPPRVRVANNNAKLWKNNENINQNHKKYNFQNINEWMNEWMNEWINEFMKMWINDRDEDPNFFPPIRIRLSWEKNQRIRPDSDPRPWKMNECFRFIVCIECGTVTKNVPVTHNCSRDTYRIFICGKKYTFKWPNKSTEIQDLWNFLLLGQW